MSGEIDTSYEHLVINGHDVLYFVSGVWKRLMRLERNLKVLFLGHGSLRVRGIV